MELIDRTAPQQCDDDLRGLPAGAVGLGGFQYLGFRMAAPKEKPFPLPLRIDCITAEAKRLIDEHEPVGLSMRKCESIFVPACVGAHDQRRFHAWAHTAAAKQLIVGSTLMCDELSQAASPQHPAHHLEETDQVGLARAVGADEHRGSRKVLYVDIRTSDRKPWIRIATRDVGLGSEPSLPAPGSDLDPGGSGNRALVTVLASDSSVSPQRAPRPRVAGRSRLYHSAVPQDAVAMTVRLP